MIARTRFGEKDWQTAVAYHLDGLLEACTKVKELAGKLDARWGSRSEVLTELLAQLEVELFHLSFHEQKLRRPFSRLVDAFHAEGEANTTVGATRHRPAKARSGARAKRRTAPRSTHSKYRH